MEDLLLRLATEPDKVVATIEEQSKDAEKITSYQKELKENDRTIRQEQVGVIQKDKTIGTGEKSKLVRAVRIPIKFSKKIVTTATAFEVGKPVTIIPSEENNLSKLLYQIWKVNRIDAAIQKLVTLKKSETQGAIQFYISDLKPESILNKILVAIGLSSQAKEIKSKILNNTDGLMTPYFDSKGNMILFMWRYKAKDSATGKELNHVEIWDAENYHYLNDASGKLAYESKSLPHGFDRIPIVYVSQNEPEWFDVKELIDRFEVAISKGGGANDRTAHPILATYGEISSLPDKDDDAKVINFPQKQDSEGRVINGDAKFIESSGGNESHKNELELIWKLIFSISQTPDLSFDNVKGLGSVSGVALKLLFLDAIIKATMNEGENRTMVDRIINVIVSGITRTTNTKLATEATSLYFDIVFNSIVPDDVKTATEIVTSLKEAGLLSNQTAIKLLDMVEDAKAELALINAEKEVKEPVLE